jgi:two-component system NtrC family response regulator
VFLSGWIGFSLQASFPIIDEDDMGKALIISSDQDLYKSTAELLGPVGHSVSHATDMSRGWDGAVKDRVDAVVVSTKLPDGDGLALLTRLKQLPTNPEVVVITRKPDQKAAEFALRNGAWDYLVLSSDATPMAASLDQAIQYREEQAGKTPVKAIKRERIIGNSPKMKACLNLLAQAAASDVNVLITGETGTGKELFARAIHTNSPRAQSRGRSRSPRAGNPRAEKNFVVVDCTALPETLVESVLFGHVKGAFTGAEQDHDGLIAHADGGTLFLDEVGELPMATQKAFLRVLQERRYRPVGGKSEKKSNFRLVAATNRNLEEMVHQDNFRKDLMFRLRSLTIELPPLRERPEDLQDLVRHHTRRLCETYGMKPKRFSPALLDAIDEYTWPGNVRELVHCIDAILAVAGEDKTLYPKHLPLHIRLQKMDTPPADTPVAATPVHPAVNQALPDFKTHRAQMERRYLEELLVFAGGNVPKACTISGISRSRLYEMLGKYNLRH